MPSSTFGYARPEDGAYIGYRVDGDGPVDIVFQTEWPGNIDFDWQSSATAPWLLELSTIGRVITHDHRGVGLSSRNVELPTLETRVDDTLAVIRATGARRPVLYGLFATGAVNALLAATRPRLARALIWLEPSARFAWAPDYPWGRDEAERQLEMDFVGLWGTEAYGKAFIEQEESAGNEFPDSASYLALQSRNACTPDVAARLAEMWFETDVRDVLGAVKTPALLLVHRDRQASVEEAEYIASRMASATVRTLPGDAWTIEEAAAWVEEVREFVGLAKAEAADTVLSTVLFTDIIDSTRKLATLGDRQWKDLVHQHHALVRRSLTRWRGVENDTAGDGFYATFDGPVRAIRCAQEIAAAVRDLGIEVRAGVHTGECEVIEGKSTGLAVSVGARVAAIAGPSDVLVSQTVKDLVAGSGLMFEDAGEHQLKGVPDTWRLHRVRSASNDA
jgi:class 3 adenylate cyclase